MEDFESLSQLSFENEKEVIPEEWMDTLQLLDLQWMVPTLSPTSEESMSPVEQTLDVLPFSPEDQHLSPGPYRPLPSKAPETPYDPPMSVPYAVSAVSLTRDQLLSFSSEDMDRFVEKITKIRPLTASERREVNKQKRLIKNRESASQSRKRKKTLIDNLEEKVGELEKINQSVSTQIKDLESDNVILKAEVAQLFTVIRDSPVLSKLLLDVATWLVVYSSVAQSKNKMSSLEIPPMVKQLQQIEVYC